MKKRLVRVQFLRLYYTTKGGKVKCVSLAKRKKK
jgi:hypothetical protein